MTKQKLIDSCNRHLNYLRLSITDRCNLRCTYCVPPDRIPKLSHANVLRYEEIIRIVKVAIKLGISKVRVTGGEPLVRKGVYEFLQDLAGLEGLKDISLTTNAVLLEKNIKKIKSAGISRINISIDTLKPEKFKQITGFDQFDQMWRGIKAAESYGFHPIKLNVVAMRGINDDELIDLARLSIENPYHIRFIEHMPIGSANIRGGSLLLAPEIKQRVSVLGKLSPVGNSKNDGPAQRYRFEGAKGEVGFIHALSQHFCDSCNRLRLTAGGQLRPCLLSDKEIDLKGPIRSGCNDREIANIFFKAVRHKPSDHNLAARGPNDVNGQMSAIGG